MMSAEEAEEGDRIESFLGGSLKDGTDQSQLSRFFCFCSYAWGGGLVVGGTVDDPVTAVTAL